MINRITLVGNIGQDAELRSTQSGQAYCYCRMATHESYKDSSGMWQKSTEWHSCKIWGNSAHRAAAQLTKGKKVFIEGALKSYQDQQQRRQWEVRVIKWWDMDGERKEDPFLPPEPLNGPNINPQTPFGSPPQAPFGDGFTRR